MGIHNRLVWLRLLSPARGVLVVALMILCGMARLAEAAEGQEIFRCEENGKIGYKSNADGEPNCHPMTFYNTDPSQEEVDRALQEKARWQAEEREEAVRAREQVKLDAQERAARALEAEANASRRRANVAEEQLRQMQSNQRNAGYPGYGGYFLGTHRPRFGDHLSLPQAPNYPMAPPSGEPHPVSPPPPATSPSHVGGDGDRLKIQMRSTTSPNR